MGKRRSNDCSVECGMTFLYIWSAFSLGIIFSLMALSDQHINSFEIYHCNVTKVEHPTLKSGNNNIIFQYEVEYNKFGNAKKDIMIKYEEYNDLNSMKEQTLHIYQGLISECFINGRELKWKLQKQTDIIEYLILYFMIIGINIIPLMAFILSA